MSNETSETSPAPDTVDLRMLVAERLKTCGEDVQNRVVEHLTEDEIAARVKLIVAALQELDKCEGDLKKIKPDSIIQDADGNTVQEGYTPARVSERKGLVKKIDKIKSSIDKALSRSDYSGLKNA